MVDFYLWKHGTDAITDVGTKRVLTLDGEGTNGTVNVLGDLNIGGCLTLQNFATVTQITSITTSVTINACNGVITTVSATTNGGSTVKFTVNNNVVTASSVILLTHIYPGNGFPAMFIDSVSSGSFVIRIRNQGGVALNNVIKINFIVVG